MLPMHYSSDDAIGEEVQNKVGRFRRVHSPSLTPGQKNGALNRLEIPQSALLVVDPFDAKRVDDTRIHWHVFGNPP